MVESTAIVNSIGIGLCYHPSHCPFCPLPMQGVVITGSSNKKINNLGSGRTGDIVLGNCGHIGILITGSSKVKVENLSQGTISSNFTGDFVGIIITGATNHVTGW